MAPSVFRRRSATAAGLYLSVALGILGTIAAARILGLHDFGRFATVMAVVGLAQTLLDLTVEESLTKFGFRYVAAEDWGKLHRLFRRALEIKVVGGALGTLVLLALLFWRMVPAALDTLVIGDLTSDLGIPFIWYWLPLLIGGAAALLAQLAITVRELAALRDARE